MITNNELEIHSAEDFAKAIRRIRKERGLSQEQLAQITGLDQSTIGRWEVGPNMVNPANFLKVMTALNGVILVKY